MVVSSLSAAGLTREQVVFLKGLGVREFPVRKSLPFVPVMFFAFIALVAWLEVFPVGFLI